MLNIILMYTVYLLLHKYYTFGVVFALRTAFLKPLSSYSNSLACKLGILRFLKYEPKEEALTLLLLSSALILLKHIAGIPATNKCG